MDEGRERILDPRVPEPAIMDSALTMRRAIRAVARAEALVARSQAAMERRRAEVDRWLAHREPGLLPDIGPRIKAPYATEPASRDEPGRAALHAAVDGYVFELRNAGNAPERAIVQLKDVLRDTPTSELVPAERAQLIQEIVGWAIEAYYRVGYQQPTEAAPWDVDALVREWLAILHFFGLRTFLGRLNARSRFRFTGLYRVEVPHLVSVGVFDRENPWMRMGGEITPLADTCCALVARTGMPFGSAETRCDGRLGATVRDSSIQSYQGVPIRLSNGRVWGTICHFDYRPRALAEPELHILARFANALARQVLEAPPESVDD